MTIGGSTLPDRVVAGRSAKSRLLLREQPYPTGMRWPGMVTLRVNPTLQDQGLPGSPVGPGCGVDCGPPEPEVG